MGLLDEYGIDLDGVEAPSYDVPDDIYSFEVGEVYIQQGTEKLPDKVWIVISYLLGDSGKTKNEWFQLPEDASNPTEKELEKLGYYKARLLDLGIDESAVNSVGADELVGIRGTLQVFTRNGWQNIKNVKLDTDDAGNEYAAPAEEEAAPVAKAPARKPAVAKAPVAAQRAAAAGVKANPFAKKA